MVMSAVMLVPTYVAESTCTPASVLPFCSTTVHALSVAMVAS
jgi:hypothetical protein